ncbi:MAG TPA: TadE/TadG family type IV pilus assembly protein [Methylocystis sp.]|nr:TadE/TadG family type IV pilus assembly protein [Methylocystis sp.]
MRSKLKSFARAREGLALVEFAAAFPVAALLLVGLVQVGDALSASRKVSITAETLDRLVSLQSSVQKADLVTIIGASSAVMAPFPNSNATIVISEVTTDAKGVATVTWSQASANGTPLPVGQTVVLPAGIVQPNVSLLLSQVSYSYSSYLGANLFGPLTLRDALYMNPRVSASVTCSDCT